MIEAFLINRGTRLWRSLTVMLSQNDERCGDLTQYGSHRPFFECWENEASLLFKLLDALTRQQNEVMSQRLFQSEQLED